MDTQKLLFELCGLNAPSGFEDAAVEYCAGLLKKYTSDVRTDRLGNVLAVIPCGKPNAKKLMLDAHIDEIGFIVSAVDKGFLRFDTLGGIDARMLPGREVIVMADEPVFGVIACLPPHLLSSEQMDKSMPVKDMYIDIGLSEEEAKKRVPIGTPAVFRDTARQLHGDLVCGKAMDDRSCFAAIVMALDMLGGKELNVDLIVLASVQEEVGMRGASIAAFAAEPDYSLIVDVEHADTPDSKSQTNCKAGNGPVISVGPNADRKLTKKIQEIAKQQEIPFQLGIHTRSSGTNAVPIQTSRAGVITAIIGLPLKYMHSPVESLRLADVEHTSKLLAAVVEGFDGEEF